MTNEEAIEIMQYELSEMAYSYSEKDIIPNNELVKSFEYAINSIQENAKLKAEIEDLHNQILCKDMTIEELGIEKNNYFTDLCKEREFCKTEKEQLKAENEQLKAELEQSVKLPCKVNQTVYEIKSKVTKCTEHNCEFDGYSCLGCECLECDSKEEYYVRDIKFYSAENILVFERHFGKTIFLTREEAEQSLKGKVQNETN